MKKISLFVLLLANLLGARIVAQDSLPGFNIALILPFQAQAGVDMLDIFETSRDVAFKNKIRLHPDAEISLNYYLGTMQALKHETDAKVKLFVYDCGNNDSITAVVLKKPELKKMDAIIGAVSTSNARQVADFCKQNKIPNVQPFSPSKTLTADNPYHLKLAPAIDAHVDAMFNSIVDSFAGGNIILYTPGIEKSLSVAQRFDSLFKDYNKTAAIKFTVSLLNTKDMMVNGKKTSATELLRAGKPNIWIITSFDESFVNGNLRVLHSQRSDFRIVVYGMPTWLNGDILRLDYVNDYNTRITDPFYLDTANVSAGTFATEYMAEYEQMPDKYSFLGYDVTRFLVQNLVSSGKGFLNSLATQRFKGTGYIFDIAKNRTQVPLQSDERLNYLENKHVNVLRVSEYQLLK
jgi:ABC-type branched-subunit amino acid transport system substrate-binding protein